jgi:hypothetical protein
MPEVARFRPDDPDPVVQASFACSYCLHQPDEATIEEAHDGAVVRCCCAPCDHEWAVMLDGEQSLRVLLRQPWSDMPTVVHHA